MSGGGGAGANSGGGAISDGAGGTTSDSDDDLLSRGVPQPSSGIYDYASAMGGWQAAAAAPSYFEEAYFNCSLWTVYGCNSTEWPANRVNGSLLDAVVLLNNGSTSADVNHNGTQHDTLADTIAMVATSVVLALIILVTIIGNVFVIAAIILERNLQNVANYLVASLAVADLMVACLVMPLGAVYEISKGWILGPELCDMWTSSDVLCCTASILHLVAIATDRYWAVTNVDYIHTRNEKRIFTMIVLVWSVALVVSLAPQLGWKDPEYMDRITLQQRCLVSQDVAYQIFATCSTFYVPLFVILVLYWKIFQTARKRIHRRRDHPTISSNTSNAPNSSINLSSEQRFLKKKSFLNLRKTKHNKAKIQEPLATSLLLTEGQSTTTVDTVDEEAPKEHRTTAFTVSERVVSVSTPAPISTISDSPEKSSTPTATNNGSASHQSQTGDTKSSAICSTSMSNVTVEHHPTHREKKESLEAKRERKAAKTLAIITGAFVFCWLPFFIMALVMSICQECVINDYISSFFLWLGYFNSTLNPVIYTIFSPDFRQAFARILFGTHRRRRVKK